MCGLYIREMTGQSIAQAVDAPREPLGGLGRILQKRSVGLMGRRGQLGLAIARDD
jgi:hypothetical protein